MGNHRFTLGRFRCQNFILRTHMDGVVLKMNTQVLCFS